MGSSVDRILDTAFFFCGRIHGIALRMGSFIKTGGIMLHKTSYMRGFHVQATDGGIGHVIEFLVDENWFVRYVVIDTSNWIGGKNVIVPSSAVAKVDSPEKKLLLRLTRAEVQGSPLVDTADIELIETLGFMIF